MYPQIGSFAAAVELFRTPPSGLVDQNDRRDADLDAASEALAADLARWQLRSEVTQAAVNQISAAGLHRTIARRAAIRCSLDSIQSFEMQSALEDDAGSTASRVVAKVGYIEWLERRRCLIDAAVRARETELIDDIDELDPGSRTHFARRLGSVTQRIAGQAHLDHSVFEAVLHDIAAIQESVADQTVEQAGETVGISDASPAMLLHSPEAAASVSYATIAALRDGSIEDPDLDGQLEWIATSARRFSDGRGTRHDGVELASRFALASRATGRGESIDAELDELERRCEPPPQTPQRTEVSRRVAAYIPEPRSGIWAVPSSPSRTLAILENRGFGDKTGNTLLGRLDHARRAVRSQTTATPDPISVAQGLVAIHESADDDTERTEITDELLTLVDASPDVVSVDGVAELIRPRLVVQPTWPSLLNSVMQLRAGAAR